LLSLAWQQVFAQVAGCGLPKLMNARPPVRRPPLGDLPTMSSHSAHGTLTLSVDLEHDHIDVTLNQQRALDEVSGELFNLFRRHQVPATWAVADPAVSLQRSRLEVSSGELALLGDSTWVGREAGRARFARELSRRVAHARSEGLQIATLVLRTPLPVEHCDLVIKEGIRAVRQPVQSARGVRSVQSVRFGLWGFAVSIALPGTSRWLPGGGGTRAARYEIDRAATEGAQVHLAIDAARLAEGGTSGLRIVQRVVEHALRRRDGGILRIVTISDVANTLGQDNRSQQPSRSILRPAA
jgi:hypothetical protein